MAKAKTVDNGAEAIEAALEQGADKVRESFEKATKSLEKFASFHKETVEAMVEAAGVAGKGAEKFQSELGAYLKSAGEGFTEASKAVFSAKSVQAAMEAQSAYAKTAFEKYVAEMTKLSELMVGTTRTALEPLQSRAQAFMDLLKAA
ncbi:MAG: phasin family protein [Alphaproteobacteria bacterium]|jgi:phasin family protein